MTLLQAWGSLNQLGLSANYYLAFLHLEQCLSASLEPSTHLRDSTVEYTQTTHILPPQEAMPCGRADKSLQLYGCSYSEIILVELKILFN